MFNREPTTIINGLSELLRQILPLLVVVGVIKLGPEQLAGWVSIIGLVLTFVTTALLRSQVVPNAKADAQIRTALRMDADSSVGDVVSKTERDSK